MHGPSVTLGLPGCLDKVVISIMLPLLSGSFQPLTPISTIPLGCKYYCLCSIYQMLCHLWLKSIMHPYHSSCNFHQAGCLARLKSPVCSDFGIKDVSSPRMTAGNAIMLSSSSYPDYWFEGVSFSPVTYSTVYSKQFFQVKVKSWI